MPEQLIRWAAPTIAALFYGGWAAYSNWDYAEQAALVAGLIQGGFAFSSTLLLTSLVMRLLQREQASFIGVFSQSSAALVTIPALLHWLAGTPNIATAMAPGLIIGHAYLWALIKKLHQLRR